MDPGSISAELRQFLRDHIETYDELELLLVIGRDPDKAWSEREIRDMMAAPSTQLGDALARLAATGALLQAGQGSSSTFACAPGMHRPIALLLEAYRTDTLALMNLLTANALERV